MKTGIIGLPQVGKTSLFKILTKARLEELIYSARHDPADEEEYPIMGRMTNVADNVE